MTESASCVQNKACELWKAFSGLLRDRKPYDGLTGLSVWERPYSLSRLQMLIWTIVILGTYVSLRFFADHADIKIGSELLGLMGIASGTALGAAFIDNSTSDGSSLDKAFKAALLAQEGIENATLANDTAALQNAQASFSAAQATLKRLAPRSVCFIIDILSDANGVNLQRIQMLGWTLAVVIIFVADAIATNKLPEPDKNLLALMGISNGVYLGFKIPEVQAKS